MNEEPNGEKLPRQELSLPSGQRGCGNRAVKIGGVVRGEYDSPVFQPLQVFLSPYLKMNEEPEEQIRRPVRQNLKNFRHPMHFRFPLPSNFSPLS